MSARRGSQTMERLPSARGPHSMRPWNQPITLPSAIGFCRPAAKHIFVGDALRRYSRRVAIRPHVHSSSAPIDPLPNCGPQIGVIHDEAADVVAASAMRQ